MNNQLTPREKEIIFLVIKGETQKSIALIFKTSLLTLNTQMKSVHRKTNTHCVAQLAMFAYENKLVVPSWCTCHDEINATSE